MTLQESILKHTERGCTLRDRFVVREEEWVTEPFTLNWILKTLWELGGIFY